MVSCKLHIRNCSTVRCNNLTIALQFCFTFTVCYIKYQMVFTMRYYQVVNNLAFAVCSIVFLSINMCTF
ncbi:Uncharacterised protein [Shigella sonnei]|nr:Uncharacterised protein [Shigella sonnei]